MNQAIEKTQEIKSDLRRTPPIEWELYMEGLKPAINNLLHMYLPKHITIEQSEVLSLVINDMIWHPEKYLNPIAKPPDQQP
jgi:hypothetical protein